MSKRQKTRDFLQGIFGIRALRDEITDFLGAEGCVRLARVCKHSQKLMRGTGIEVNITDWDAWAVEGRVDFWSIRRAIVSCAPPTKALVPSFRNVKQLHCWDTPGVSVGQVFPNVRYLSFQEACVLPTDLLDTLHSVEFEDSWIRGGWQRVCELIMLRRLAIDFNTWHYKLMFTTCPSKLLGGLPSMQNLRELELTGAPPETLGCVPHNLVHLTLKLRPGVCNLEHLFNLRLLEDLHLELSETEDVSSPEGQVLFPHLKTFCLRRWVPTECQLRALLAHLEQSSSLIEMRLSVKRWFPKVQISFTHHTLRIIEFGATERDCSCVLTLNAPCMSHVALTNAVWVKEPSAEHRLTSMRLEHAQLRLPTVMSTVTTVEVVGSGVGSILRTVNLPNLKYLRASVAGWTRHFWGGLTEVAATLRALEVFDITDFDLEPIEVCTQLTDLRLFNNHGDCRGLRKLLLVSHGHQHLQFLAVLRSGEDDPDIDWRNLPFPQLRRVVLPPSLTFWDNRSPTVMDFQRSVAHIPVVF
jgi:hypothetical protein